MKKLSKAVFGLVALLVGILIWRFVQIRSGHSQVPPIGDDLYRLFTQPFFKVGATEVTASLLCVIVFFLVLITSGSSLSKRVTRKVLEHTSLDEGQRYAIEIGTGYLVFFAGLMIFLQSAGLDLSSLAVVGGAIGVGIGFGLQNIFNNFVSGIILLIERPIKLGDRVQVSTMIGDVVRIGARSTWVKTNDDIVVIVPNSEFISNSVTNWTASDRQTRFAIPMGVGYGSNITKVKEILLKVAALNPDVLDHPAPDVILTDFGDNSINFALRVWTIAKVRTPNLMKSDLYFEIHRVFEENNIELPFPQRDIHIRTPLTIERVSQRETHHLA